MGSGEIKPEDNEMIAYRLYNSSLERYDSSGPSWHTLSDNIDALNLVYLDQDGNRTYTPNEFRAIELTILAKTNKKDKDFNNNIVYKNKQGENLCSTCINDQYHRRLVSTTLQLRNLSLQDNL